jgi:methylthioribose-1-phosphate isomerase
MRELSNFSNHRRSFLLPDNNESRVQPLEWRDGTLRFIDQTLLPGDVRYVETRDYRVVRDAIRRLAIRGAPLIGIAAAYALALAAHEGVDLRAAADALTSTRPTAVNLRWALDRVLAAGQSHGDTATNIETEARAIHEQQLQDDVRTGELGAALIDEGATVLTHCNTGALATGGIGTALGVIKTAHAQGKRLRVLVDETRPLLQGARLTAWELAQEQIPHKIIVDAAAASLIAAGAVGAVLVGADRITANGDVANKIGTYALALAAHAHDVPFYVVAPTSTIDRVTATGSDIAIEQRDPAEVLTLAQTRVAPGSSDALNPAFDVTPGALVSAIITECGILRPPYDRSLAGATIELAAAR